MGIASSAVIHVCRVFAIAKTRNNDANEESSVPGCDELVIQWGKDDESKIKESKPDMESAAIDLCHVFAIAKSWQRSSRR